MHRHVKLGYDLRSAVRRDERLEGRDERGLAEQALAVRLLRELLEYALRAVVLEARQPTRNGFTPRIHVFSVKSPQATPDDQVRWIEDELTKLAGGKKRFAVLELSRSRHCPGGSNQRLRTATQIKGRTVKAIRQVYFRKGRTYFFAGYVDERDYDRLQGLIEASLATFELDGDRS